MPEEPIPPRSVFLAILHGVAHAPEVWSRYVLKGGLALWLVYGSPRRSADFDFTALHAFSQQLTDDKNERLRTFCDRLNNGLAEVAGEYGFREMVVRGGRLSDEIPAVMTGVDCVPEEGEPCRVEMQVTLSEAVFNTREAEVEGVPVHVPTLEDVAAAKMKALLQSPTRHKSRSVDVYDLWWILEASPHEVDRTAVRAALLRKARPWEVIQPVTRAAYDDPAVRADVAPGYPAIQDDLETDAPFPSFDDAFAAILAFADTLDLPQEASAQ